MKPADKENSLDRIVRLVLTAAGAVAFFLLLRFLSDVLLPFAAAVILAYLINPIVRVFESKIKSRGAAVVLTLVGMGLFGIAIVAVIVPLMWLQVERFERSISRLRADMVAARSELPDEMEPFPEDVPAGISDDLDPANGSFDADEHSADGAEEGASNDGWAGSRKSPLGWTELRDGWREYRRDGARGRPRSERIAELYQAISGTFFGDNVDDAIAFTDTARFRELVINSLKSLAVGGLTVLGFFFNFLAGMIGLVIVLLYLVFLLIDYPKYSRTWPNMIPPQYRNAVVEFLGDFNNAMRRYFRGQAVVALLTGTLFAIGFTIIGLPMAVPFGLLIGLLNMVPYLSAVAVVPALLLAALRAIEGDASLLGSILLVLTIFAVVQLIQDAIITPRIMGQATGLRPVAILLGIFIWGKLLGFLGILLAIPLTCLVLAYYQRYVLEPGRPALVPPMPTA